MWPKYQNENKNFLIILHILLLNIAITVLSPCNLLIWVRKLWWVQNSSRWENFGESRTHLGEKTLVSPGLIWALFSWKINYLIITVICVIYSCFYSQKHLLGPLLMDPIYLENFQKLWNVPTEILGTGITCSNLFCWVQKTFPKSHHCKNLKFENFGESRTHLGELQGFL
jgi:hypothetical protein